jgi:hypothetical protein
MDNTVSSTGPEPPVMQLIRMILDLPEDRQAVLLKIVEDFKADGIENQERDDVRHPYTNAIEFVCQDRNYSGTAQDISEGGMFIKTPVTLSVGQIIIIKVPFRDNHRRIHVPAEVVRSVADGIGVKFFKKDVSSAPQTA